MTGQAPRVLVVDGALVQRLIVQRSAAALRVAADAAGDVADASRMLCGHRYAVVVLDLALDAEDGRELLRTLAATGARSRLVLTGSDMQARQATGWLAASLGLEVVALLPKPLDLEGLRAALLAAVAGDAGGNGGTAPPQVVAADLCHALAAGEVTQVFQPQVALGTGRLTGAEVLARWTSPRFGAVPPDVFVPLAGSARSGAMLLDVTLRAACGALPGWRRRVPAMRVSLNLSATVLADPGIPQLILGRLNEAHLPPDALEVEVAELDAAACGAALAALRSLGIGAVLDDFGTGGTSLAALAALPVQALKISRQLVQRCTAEPQALRLVRAIAAAARALGLGVVAVGVETAAIQAQLLDAGCDQAQGWLLGPPMSMDGLTRWLGQEGRA